MADKPPKVELRYYNAHNWDLVIHDKKSTVIKHYDDGYDAWLDMQVQTGLIDPMGEK